MSEKERADAFLITLRNRLRYTRLQNRLLKGDAEQRKTLAENWKPLTKEKQTR